MVENIHTKVNIEWQIRIEGPRALFQSVLFTVEKLLKVYKYIITQFWVNNKW